MPIIYILATASEHAPRICFAAAGTGAENGVPQANLSIRTETTLPPISALFMSSAAWRASCWFLYRTVPKPLHELDRYRGKAGESHCTSCLIQHCRTRCKCSSATSTRSTAYLISAPPNRTAFACTRNSGSLTVFLDPGLHVGIP